MTTLERKIIFLVAVILFAIEFYIFAWLGDDALITFRSVRNFLSGFGPVFNVGERVQSFTHPLWFLLLSAMTVLTKNVAITSILLSAIFSAFTLYILCFYIARSRFGLIMGLSCLFLSKAYVEYSSSGLENPLSHFLLISSIALGLSAFQKQNSKFLLYFLISYSSLYLSRPDLVILLFPFLILVVHKSNYLREQKLVNIFGFISLGFSPLLIWTAFSIFYYGFPFPNTAYAKLIGVSHSILIYQGFWYLWNSIIWDPITLFTIGASIALTVKYRRCDNNLLISISLGIFLYLIYILYIGGDFMTGRFLSAPLLLASVICSRLLWDNKILRSVAITFMLMLAVISIYLNVLSFSGWLRPMRHMHGVADERSYYYNYINRTREFAEQPWRLRNEQPYVFITHCGNLGVLGLDFGPKVYLSDQCALADPLLARLPLNPNSAWRIGHAVREIPTGYWESLEQNKNNLINPMLGGYYEALSLVTRGPLWSIKRLQAVLKFNLGLINNPDLRFLYDYEMPIPKLDEEIDFSNIQNYPYFPPAEWGWSYPAQESMLTVPKNNGLLSKNGDAYFILPVNPEAKDLQLKLINRDNQSTVYPNFSIQVDGKIFDQQIRVLNSGWVSINLSHEIDRSKYILVHIKQNRLNQSDKSEDGLFLKSVRYIK